MPNLYKQYIKEYRRVVLSLVDKDTYTKILDLGCGDEEFTIEIKLKAEANLIWGIDRKTKKDPNIIKRVSNLEETFPFGDEQFDGVCASQVIEHLSNTDNFIKEIHRVLKPEGYLILSTNNLASWHNILYLILGLQPPCSMVSDEMYGEEIRPRHRRIFTFSSLCKLLKFHGFKIEKTVGTSYYPLPTQLARLMCRIDKAHSVCINIKARKE